MTNFATTIVNHPFEKNESLFIGKMDEWLETHNTQMLKSIIGSKKYDGRQFAYVISQIEAMKTKKVFWIEMNESHVPLNIPAKGYIYLEKNISI